MDPRAFLVAALFGGGLGWGFTRRVADRGPVRWALLASVLIGAVVWLVEPSHLAGPVLTVGGAAGLAGSLLPGARELF